jgi:4-diphosphocytidyl-2C-methyl-D-erythritol kinase
MLESAIRKRSLSLIARHLTNDLERVVARRYGVVGEVLEALRAAKPIGVCMSGSGSSVFALAEDQGEAVQLANVLRRRDHLVHVLVCRPLRRGLTYV